MTKKNMFRQIAASTLLLACCFSAAPAQGEVLLTSDGFKYTITDNQVTITGCAEKCPLNLIIPSTLSATGSAPVVATANYAFNGQEIASAKIAKSITTIGTGTFQDVSTLTKVEFESPSSVKEILGYALAGTGITSLNLPNTLETLGYGAFGWAESLTSVSIASGSKLATISDYAFADSRISWIELPASVTTLGSQAFADSPNLTSVTFLGNLPTAENDSFARSPITKFYRLSTATGWESTFQSIPVELVAKPSYVRGAAIKGTAAKAKTLSLAVGTWNNGHASSAFTYQWYHCPTKIAKITKCSKISAAVKPSVKLTSAHVGKFIRVKVTVTNAVGSSILFITTSGKVASK